MTAPLVFQDPGFGGSIQEGFTPLLVMLQHQQEMKLKQNQLAQEQQRIDLEAQRTQSALSTDATTRAANKLELKQRQQALDVAVEKYKGEQEAGALFNSLTAKNLQPGTSEWNNAYAQAVGAHAGKDYGIPFVDKFNQLVSNDYTLKHQQAQTNLEKAQAEEASAKAAAARSKTTEVNPGNDVITTDLKGNELGRVKGPPAIPKRSTVAQIQTAAAGAAAAAAWRDFDKTRRLNPGVETEVGAIVNSPTFIRAIPGFKNAADAIQLFQKSGASRGAQSYFRRKIDFLDQLALTKGYKSRLTGPVLQLLMGEYMPGADPQGLDAMHQNESQGLLSAITSSGYDENPDVWNNAAKRAGVGDLTPDMILNGQSVKDPTLDAIKGRGY